MTNPLTKAVFRDVGLDRADASHLLGTQSEWETEKAAKCQQIADGKRERGEKATHTGKAVECTKIPRRKQRGVTGGCMGESEGGCGREDAGGGYAGGGYAGGGYAGGGGWLVRLTWSPG